jgi:signal peptidase I
MIFFKSSIRKLLEECEALYQTLRKNRIYSSDLLKPDDFNKLVEVEVNLRAAIRSKDESRLKEAYREGLKLGERLFPAPRDAFLRENVEVLIVALVIALAVRSYFLQPFKIPTGSMEPTLSGVQINAVQEPPPNWFLRILQVPTLGRFYTSLQTKEGGQVTRMDGGHMEFRLFTFDYTDVTIGRETERVWVDRNTLELKFGVRIGNSYPPGLILNLRTDTGDQVFVNKMIYNFRKPHRGEVFVFKTTGITEIEEPRHQQGFDGSQYYIKRCVGVPGDRLSLAPPYLKVNGEITHSAAFDRIYSCQNGYHGYVITHNERQKYLTSPEDAYTVHEDNFWAAGDNSANSFDSRYWGPVPRENVVGTGSFVYWPFTAHWGRIQ